MKESLSGGGVPVLGDKGVTTQVNTGAPLPSAGLRGTVHPPQTPSPHYLCSAPVDMTQASVLRRFRFSQRLQIFINATEEINGDSLFHFFFKVMAQNPHQAITKLTKLPVEIVTSLRKPNFL